MNKNDIINRVEMPWDYDWILYHEYRDGSKKNAHTDVLFDTIKTKEEFWLTYQFYWDYLVWYSIYKAEWLNIDDNLNDVWNTLWWTRWPKGNQELIFRPIKDLSYLHIKNIIRDYDAWILKVQKRIIEYFRLIKVIEWQKISQQDTEKV